MRVLVLASVLFSTSLWAAAPTPSSVQPVLELSGVNLICQQAEPLLKRGIEAKQQAQIGVRFAPEAFCQALAARIAKGLTGAQLQAAHAALASERASRFTALERAVGDNNQALIDYGQKLKQQPPLGERLALVRSLDHSAHTSELATLLRYEVGKTQALLGVLARGQRIDEKSLSEQTAQQRDKLASSSREAVEAFMLFAYRTQPGDEIAAYRDLYLSEPIKAFYAQVLKALPALFAERRAQLK